MSPVVNVDRYRLRLVLLAILLAINSAAYALIEARHFDDPARKQLYEKLIGELRCLVCQNENLAASSADLAGDLRQEAYEMVEKGANEQEVLDYMTARYGQFVLYRPRFEPVTVLLWAGPGLLLAIGLGVVVMLVRRRRAGTEELSDDKRRQARSLLED